MESAGMEPLGLGLSMDLDMPDLGNLSAVNDSFLGEYLSQLEQRYDGALPGNGQHLTSDPLQELLSSDIPKNLLPEPTILPSVQGGTLDDMSTLKDSGGSMNGHHSAFKDSAGSVGDQSNYDIGPEHIGLAFDKVHEEDLHDKSKGKKKVTQQRKQNNRRAQQRYREKRRQQAAELETTVAALTAQLEAMQGVQSQAAQLSGENEALRKRAEAQQQTILQLQKQLKAHMLQSHQVASTSELHVASVETDDMDSFHTPEPESNEAASRQLKEVLKELTGLLTHANLPLDAVSSRPSDYAAVDEELKRLATQAIKLAMRMALEAPLCPVETVAAEASGIAARHTNCAVFKSKWFPIIAGLRLTDAQVDACLDARSSLLSVLRGIYEERQNLNMLAMSIMLPRPHPNRKYDGLEGKIRCIERFGSSCALQHGNQLDEVLDSLKLNLRAEEKVVTELNHKVLRKVLTPIQAAVVILQSAPCNVEALALVNLLAIQRGVLDCED